MTQSRKFVLSAYLDPKIIGGAMTSTIGSSEFFVHGGDVAEPMEIMPMTCLYRGTGATFKIVLVPSQEDRLSGQLQSYAELPNGWDGDNGKPASKQAIADALAFLSKRPTDIPLPYVQLASDGEVGLYWHSDSVFADIGFYGTGEYSYYAKYTSVDGTTIEKGRDHCRVTAESWDAGLLNILNKLSSGALEPWPALARILSDNTVPVGANVSFIVDSSQTARVNWSPLASILPDPLAETSDLFERSYLQYKLMQTPELSILPLSVM